ncbi:MAG: DUF4363 family protein [Clostridia bacterium]|nr:DUF4363 family protein [Clostridia bacterium]
MIKNIVTASIVLVLILGCGIWEVVALKQDYQALQAETWEVMQKCIDQTLTESQYQQLCQHWVELRETSELLLPHIDVYEINLRFAEGKAYCKQGDFKQLYAQLCVAHDLLQYVPHLMVPNLRHIV